MVQSVETVILKILIIDLLTLQGGSGEGMSVESTEIKSEVHNTGFKVMALNIFFLMAHLDELRIFINEQRPHIID